MLAWLSGRWVGCPGEARSANPGVNNEPTNEVTEKETIDRRKGERRKEKGSESLVPGAGLPPASREAEARRPAGHIASSSPDETAITKLPITFQESTAIG